MDALLAIFGVCVYILLVLYGRHNFKGLLGFLIFISALIPEISDFYLDYLTIPLGGLKVRPEEIILLALFTVWGGRLMKHKVRMPESKIVYVYLIFLFVIMVSVIRGAQNGISPTYALSSGRACFYYAIFFLVYSAIENTADIEYFLQKFILGLVFFNLFTLYLMINKSSAFWNYIYTVGQDRASIRNGMLNIFVVPLLVRYLLLKKGNPLVWSFGLFICFISMLLGQSRAALAEVTIILVITIWLLKRNIGVAKKIKLTTVFGTLLLVVAGGFLIVTGLDVFGVDMSQFTYRLNTIVDPSLLLSDPSILWRLMLAGKIIELIFQNPFFGMGSGYIFDFTVMNKPGSLGYGSSTSADNSHLTALLYYGVIGYSVLLIFYIWFAYKIREVYHYQDTYTKQFAATMIAMFIGIMMVSVASDFLVLSKMCLVIGMFLGIILWLSQFRMMPMHRISV